MVEVLNIIKTIAVSSKSSNENYQKLMDLGQMAEKCKKPILNSNITYLRKELLKIDKNELDKGSLSAYDYAEYAIFELEKKVID